MMYYENIYEYLTSKKIFPPDQRRILEQARFTNSCKNI